MTEASRFNSTIAGVGLLFRGRDEVNRAFLGSCFSLVRPDVFVTAAHCVHGTSKDRLWVNHHAGSTPDLFTPVRDIVPIFDADIAVVTTDAPEPKWAQPFQKVRFSANLGERVCALGFTEQSFRMDVPAKETPRFFRGTIQRPFIHKASAIQGSEYSAYELSFPCPSGLSGGPLFLEEDPTIVIGVVTEDIEAGRLLWQENVDQSPMGPIRTETYRVVNYGVASNIMSASEQLEALLCQALPVANAG